MRYVIIAFLMASSLFAQDAKPSVAKCQADAKLLDEQLAGHWREVEGREDDQFSTTVGQLPSNILVSDEGELIECVGVDPARRDFYVATMRRTDSLLNYRFMYFLLNTGQMRDFAEWETSKQKQQRDTFPNLQKLKAEKQ
ncbi:MAG TPA: hypothetical protein VFA74_09300 [Terriglobales bacterium]|nr:hypothetical protein [Terriglobales bacterium]